MTDALLYRSRVNEIAHYRSTVSSALGLTTRINALDLSTNNHSH